MYDALAKQYREQFGEAHRVAAFAPGRVEVLGNHTDYNEGFVLSAAINYGTIFLVSPVEGTQCRLVAADLDEEVAFDVGAPAPVEEHTWANYVIGVVAGLQEHGARPGAFNALLGGNIPLGAGLSSSAALEMCAGLALAAGYEVEIDPLTMAKIGQASEHRYAGVKCGLMDQVSSLFGRANALVMTDFRSLDIEAVPLGSDAAFLMCNTHAKHALVDGAYNERREHCEVAAAYFDHVLDHPVQALRDVDWTEWARHASAMDPMAAQRAAHIIGENARVMEGRQRLQAGDLAGFGQLMFESHDSSVTYFENSCAELDTVVNAAKEIPAVLGARLSGGGFGGSVVVLVHPRDAEAVAHAINVVFKRAHGHPCDVSLLEPSDGAHLLT